jgi:hypothetical protein
MLHWLAHSLLDTASNADININTSYLHPTAEHNFKPELVYEVALAYLYLVHW